MSNVRFALTLVTMVACGGSAASDLASKSWKKLDPVPGLGLSGGGVFDVKGRIVVSGSVNDHTIYRYDPAARVWSTLGASPVDNSGWVMRGPDGQVLFESNDAQGLNVLYELDDTDTWRPFITLPQGISRITFGAGGVMWSTVNDGTLTKVFRRTTSDFIQTWDVQINASIEPDNLGQIIINRTEDDGIRRIGVLNAEGNGATTAYSCNGQQLPTYCNSSNHHFYTTDGGDLLFVAETVDARMYRVRAGTTEPVEEVRMPTEGDNSFEVTTYPVGFGYDAAGNAYSTRWDNRGGPEILFVRDHSGGAFEFVGRMPGFLTNLLIRPDGTLFCVDGSGAHDFYILE